MTNTIVIGMGGNAILKDGERGTREEQAANLEAACHQLVPLAVDGHRLVLIHGNGPQVGNLLVQQAESDLLAPAQPMDICVAMTQGQIGTMLQQALANELRATGVERDVVTLVSHFLVDPDDAAFGAPSKPIGPFLTEEMRDYHQDHAARMGLAGGQTILAVGNDPERPYRRVVASPIPLRLVERRALKALVDSGAVVVAAGGGGIPVVMDATGAYRSVEAVIDKDLASEKLAESVAADVLLLLTEVERVALDFGTPNARPIDRMTLSEAKRHYAEGQFPPGSMGPKVLACIQFLEYGGSEAIIGGLGSAASAVRGETGTHFVADDDLGVITR
jgi:carbamate kinase